MRNALTVQTEFVRAPTRGATAAARAIEIDSGNVPEVLDKAAHGSGMKTVLILARHAVSCQQLIT